MTETPVVFAVQDGNGAWRRITPTTTGGSTKLAFTLSQGRGGVANVPEQETIGFSRDASAVAAVANSRSRLRLAQSLKPGVDARLAAASARRRPTF